MIEKATIKSVMYQRTKVFLAARLAVISFFMGLVVFYQVGHISPARYLQALIPVATAYGLTIIYAIALKFDINLRRFSLLQLVLDTLLVTSIIYYTGGVSSPFSFMYILVIFAGAILLDKRAAFYVASLSSVLYGLSLNLELYEIIHPHTAFLASSPPQSFRYYLVTTLINIALFYLVAYLSGYLADLLRTSDRRLVKASEDFTLLQAFHENVLKNMGSGFLAVDFDLSILSHNRAAETILGLDKSELEKTKIDKTLQFPRISSYLQDHEIGNTPQTQFNWVYKKKDGVNVDLSMTVSQFVTGGATQGAIVVFQDITHLKKMERRVANAERLASIGRMVAGVAHEIRNPLGSLSGCIQMLSADIDPYLDDSGKRLMVIINREVERLNSTITRFLQYSAPDNIIPVKVDLTAILNDTLFLLKSDPKLSGKVVLVESIEKNLYIHGDPEQIRQIIWNLCVNAIDAMAGEGKLGVSAHYSSDTHDDSQSDIRNERGYVYIKISDTGKGIGSGDMEKIFDPFYTSKINGTGLGLAICQKIASSHRAKISVVSEPSAGALFTVRFPVEGNATA